MQLKQTFFVILFCTLYQLCFSQINTSTHHRYFNQARKTRFVVNKKYNHISDSAYVSYEFLIGNVNNWTGDVYNQYPSAQFICSYDNNTNFEIGVFGCYTSTSLSNINPNGIDLFVSYKLKQKWYVIVDVYTFIANKKVLLNELGYNAKTYNLYSARLQYNANSKNSFFTGYSILNDTQKLQ
jgi:hypothetical protein